MSELSISQSRYLHPIRFQRPSGDNISGHLLKVTPEVMSTISSTHFAKCCREVSLQFAGSVIQGLTVVIPDETCHHLETRHLARVSTDDAGCIVATVMH